MKLPVNMDAEQAVLGAILLEPQRIFDIELRSEEFGQESHRVIYRAMSELVEQQRNPDAINVISYLRDRNKLPRAGNESYIHQLGVVVLDANQIQEHAKLIRSSFIQREIIMGGQKLIALGSATNGKSDFELVTAAQSILNNLNTPVDPQGMSMYDAVGELFKQIQEYVENPKEIRGIPTGFVDLDKVTDGISPSSYWIIAGDPGTGKTSFVLDVLKNTAKQGHRSTFFSLEMPRDKLLLRMACNQTGINAYQVKRGNITKAQHEQLIEAMALLQKLPITIVAERISTAGIRTHLSRLKRIHQLPELAIVDYSKLLTDTHESEVIRMMHISLAIKGIANEFGVPIVLVHTLTRSADHKMPELSDLGWGRQFEYDADVVLLLYVDPKQDPNDITAKIAIGKNREGASGMPVLMTFDKRYTRWGNYSNGHARLP